MQLDGSIHMQFKPFGNTKINLPELGFGTYSLRSEITPKSTAIETLIRAYELGVRLFDTAPSYGNGECDTLLGEAFGTLNNNEIFIAAKLSGPHSNNQDYSYDACMKAFESTLQGLKRNSVPLLQLHCIPSWRDIKNHDEKQWNNFFGDNMGYQALLDIKSQGGCQFIGITGHWSPFIKKCLEYTEFDTVQIASHYNLTNKVARKTILPIAKKRNMPIIIANPLGGGTLISLKNLEDMIDNGLINKEYWDIDYAINVLKEMAENKGYELYQLALLYLLQEPLAFPIQGAKNIQELELNLALNKLPKLTNEEYIKLESVPTDNLFLKGKNQVLTLSDVESIK